MTAKTKKTEQKVTQQQPDVINPNDYVYENGQNVEIDGQFMLELLKTLHVKLQEEIEIKFEIVNETDKDGKVKVDSNGRPLPPKKERKVYLTEFGNYLEAIINYFSSIHNKNIVKGVAKKKSTPTFDLTSVTKK